MKSENDALRAEFNLKSLGRVQSEMFNHRMESPENFQEFDLIRRQTICKCELSAKLFVKSVAMTMNSSSGRVSTTLLSGSFFSWMPVLLLQVFKYLFHNPGTVAFA